MASSFSQQNGHPIEHSDHRVTDHSDSEDVNMLDQDHENVSNHSDDNHSDSLDQSDDLCVDIPYSNHGHHNDSDLANGNTSNLQPVST